MATYEALRQAIDTLIKANGNKEITGDILNNVLNTMITALSANYQFCGEAKPNTAPGQPLQNLFYFAYEAGTYVNFGGITLPLGISMLKWDGTAWTGENIYKFDPTPLPNSNNLISSGAVFNAFIQLSNAMNSGCIYAGIAEPSTTPQAIVNGQPIFYLATEKGTYPNFLVNGDIPMVLDRDGIWILTSSSDDDDWNAVCLIEIDSEPQPLSSGLISSKGVYNAIKQFGETFGFGKLYNGVATPTTTPDPLQGRRMFYLATQAGTYTHFLANGDIPLVIPHDGLYAIFSVTGEDDDDWNWEQILQFDNEITSDSEMAPSSQAVYNTLETFKAEVNALIADINPTVIEGNVTNAPDEEDLTSVNERLKFKDKNYNAISASGLGRVYLRKNWVNGVNTLTQAMMNEANTIYHIQYDYVLGEDITVPENCVLEFDGGSISNGSINLNGCGFIGKGLKGVEISNPSSYIYPISYYLGDTSDPSLNRSVLQTLVDSNIDVIIDINSITFSDYISIKSQARIMSSDKKKRTLRFPNSAGFIWDTKAYSHNNYFEGLMVSSKGHCFDFSNNDSTTVTAYNVYRTQFENIYANSDEGSCFYAGRNKAFNGNGLVFETQFQNVSVNAPLGSGFKGLPKTTSYTNIYVDNCGVAVLHNCAGMVTCLNTSNVSTTSPAFKSDASLSQQITFNLCNFEDHHSTIFDCAGGSFQWIEFNQCSFHIYGNSQNDNKVEYYPFKFDWIRSFNLRGCRFDGHNNSGGYDGNYCTVYSRLLTNTSVYTDVNIECYCGSQAKKYTFSSESITSLGNSPFGQARSNTLFKGTDKLNTKHHLISYDLLDINPFEYSVENNSQDVNVTFQLKDTQFYNIKAVNDLEGYNIRFSTFYTYTDWTQIKPYKITVRNGNANCTIQFATRQYAEGNSNIYSESGGWVAIRPKQTVDIIIFPRGYFGNYTIGYVLQPVNVYVSKAGTTTNRPTQNLYIGQMYYDSTLNKPIWYKGKESNVDVWIDAAGTPV